MHEYIYIYILEIHKITAITRANWPRPRSLAVLYGLGQKHTHIFSTFLSSSSRYFLLSNTIKCSQQYRQSPYFVVSIVHVHTIIWRSKKLLTADITTANSFAHSIDLYSIQWLYPDHSTPSDSIAFKCNVTIRQSCTFKPTI